MRKLSSFIIICLVCFGLTLSLSACGEKKNNNSNVDPDIIDMYNKAVDNGETRSLNQWLDYIKGLKGEQGESGKSVVITIGNDGYFYINGEKFRPARGTSEDKPTLTINEENNHFYLGDIDTGIDATSIKGETGDAGNEGSDGDVLTLGADDYWYINDVCTYVKRTGAKGEIGEDAEIYAVTYDFGDNYEAVDCFKFVNPFTLDDQLVKSDEWIVDMPIIKNRYSKSFLGWFIKGTNKQIKNYDRIGGDVTIEPRFIPNEFAPVGVYRDNRLYFNWYDLLEEMCIISEDGVFLANKRTSYLADLDFEFDLVLGTDLYEVDGMEMGVAIREISNYAFADCRNLRNVIITSGVNKVGNYAFSNCRNLKSIELPSTIGWNSSLSEKRITGYDNSTVTIKYDSGNIFGYITGEFGEIEYLPKRIKASASSGVANGFNRLSELYEAFIEEYKWCSQLHISNVDGYHGTNINVYYDDCNPFGMVAGEFGDIANITNHTNNFDYDAVEEDFTTLSNLFSAFLENYQWNYDIYYKQVVGYNNSQINLAYHKNNPFGAIGGEFGNIENISKQTDLMASESIAADFDTLSEMFNLFISSFAIPMDGSEYNAIIGSWSYGYYDNFYQKALEMYTNSLISSVNSIASFAGMQNRSAVIGLNYPYSLMFELNSDLRSIDYQDVLAKLFGYSTKDELINAAQIIADICNQQRSNVANGLPIIDAIENSAFYTSDGSFVFPLVVHNKYYLSVLTYLIVDSNGLVSIWVSDVCEALWATNYNSNFYASDLIENQLYSKNDLFITGTYLEGFSSLYYYAFNLYKDSNVLFINNLEDNINGSAIVGLNHIYSLALEENNLSYLDYQEMLSKAFGFNSTSAFLDYAQMLADLYAGHRADIGNSLSTTAALDNGCFYAENGSFIFPIIIGNQPSTMVLLYLFNDTKGQVSLWINDVNDLIKITNFDGSKRAGETIKLQLYCKNQIFAKRRPATIILDESNDDKFIEMYNQALSIYNNSLMPFTHDAIKDVTKSALIGLNNEYSFIYADSVDVENVDLQLAISKLFGLNSKEELKNYAGIIAETCFKRERFALNSSEILESLDELYFSTSDGSFVFPMVIQNDITGPILGFIIVDKDGLISIWINNIIDVLSAVNYSDEYMIDRTVNNQLYGKNILFVTGPVGIGNGLIAGSESIEHISIDSNAIFTDNGSNVLVNKVTNTLIAGCNNSYIPEGVETIGSYAFAGLNIDSIAIPASVKEILVGAFQNCKNLESVIFEDNSDLVYICINAFGKCESLQSVILPQKLRVIESNAFNSCTALKSVEFPSSVQSIGEKAFFSCISLTDVDLSDPEHLVIGKNAFTNCLDLRTVTISAGVKEIGTLSFSNCQNLINLNFAENADTKIKDRAFYNCTSLTSVTFPSNINSIGVRAFYNCNSLETIEFKNQNGLTIGEYAFYNNNLSSVTFGENLILTLVGECAFAGQKEIELIHIPNTSYGVYNSIGDRAFIGTENLKTVYLDSQAIVNGITDVTSGGSILQYCENLYLASDIEIPSTATYILDRFDYVVTDEGYNYYSIKQEADHGSVIPTSEETELLGTYVVGVGWPENTIERVIEDANLKIKHRDTNVFSLMLNNGIESINFFDYSLTTIDNQFYPSIDSFAKCYADLTGYYEFTDEETSIKPLIDGTQYFQLQNLLKRATKLFKASNQIVSNINTNFERSAIIGINKPFTILSGYGECPSYQDSRLVISRLFGFDDCDQFDEYTNYLFAVLKDYSACYDPQNRTINCGVLSSDNHCQILPFMFKNDQGNATYAALVYSNDELALWVDDLEGMYKTANYNNVLGLEDNLRVNVDVFGTYALYESTMITYSHISGGNSTGNSINLVGGTGGSVVIDFDDLFTYYDLIFKFEEYGGLTVYYDGSGCVATGKWKINNGVIELETTETAGLGGKAMLINATAIYKNGRILLAGQDVGSTVYTGVTCLMSKLPAQDD